MNETSTPSLNLLLNINDNGDKEKIISMITLGGGSFICGLIPYKLGTASARCPLTISILLCFGAGVLLATSLVHMLPDVRKGMPKNAEIALCGGFFIIYFIDEFIHYCFGESIQHSHHNENLRNRSNYHHHEHQHQSNYGSIVAANDNLSETQSLLADNQSQQHQQKSHSHCNSDEVNARICHIVHNEPCTDTMTGTFGLVCALSLHSFIEGIAIGVQSSGSKVFFLLTAVSAHKFVMAFCLGLEYCSNSTTTLRKHLIAIAVFSLGSVIGIATGMIFVDFPETWSKNAIPILNALAGGTLLYVTVSEVLPREKARWHQNSRKIAGLIQFIAVAIGFAIMTILDFYLDDDK